MSKIQFSISLAKEGWINRHFANAERLTDGKGQFINKLKIVPALMELTGFENIGVKIILLCFNFTSVDNVI